MVSFNFNKLPDNFNDEADAELDRLRAEQAERNRLYQAHKMAELAMHDAEGPGVVSPQESRNMSERAAAMTEQALASEGDQEIGPDSQSAA